MTKKVRKAIIPAAGFGTRFLPFSKAVPKELIPLVDKPVLQYVLEEALASGIEEVLMIISDGKESIRHFLEPACGLEERLAAKNRLGELAGVRELMEKLKISYVFQPELNGLGGAVACARDFAGGEPFAILNGDTVMQSSSDIPVLRQLADVYEAHPGVVIALEEVPMERVKSYGVVGGPKIAPHIVKVEKMVEKPAPEEAPSNLAIAARYIYTPEIFDCIARTAPGKSGEIQLPDATVKMLDAGIPVHGCIFAGSRYDIGDKLSFLKSTVEFGLRRPEFSAKFADFICQTARKIEEGKNV